MSVGVLNSVMTGLPILNSGGFGETTLRGRKTMTSHFELWRVDNSEAMILNFGNQEIRFGVRELDDLKNEIRGWELRYYGD